MVDQTSKCCDFITGLLWQLPTIFGRLILLASAWDAGSKRYHHSVIERAFPPQITHDAFQRLHEEIFQQWMRLTDSQRKGDLARYMDSGKLSESAMVEVWINSEMYKDLFPPDASFVDRQAFVRVLAILLIRLAGEQRPVVEGQGGGQGG